MSEEKEPYTTEEEEFTIWDAFKADEYMLSNMQRHVNAVTSAMSEIRMALNLPGIAEEQTGLGDRTNLKPMFEADKSEEIQEKYLELSTFLVRLVKQELDPPKR